MNVHLSFLLIDNEVLSLENYDCDPKVAASDHDSSMANEAMDVVGSENTANALNPHLNFTLAEYGDTIQTDAFAFKSLELAANLNDVTKKDSQLSFSNKAWTPAGKRVLLRWSASPLTST